MSPAEVLSGLEARQRHLRHFSALAGVAREAWLSTRAQLLVTELDDDYENVRAALEWAAAADPCTGMRMLGGTRDLFFGFGQAAMAEVPQPA